jgi:hypothetical protein
MRYLEICLSPISTSTKLVTYDSKGADLTFLYTRRWYLSIELKKCSAHVTANHDNGLDNEGEELDIIRTLDVPTTAIVEPNCSRKGNNSRCTSHNVNFRICFRRRVTINISHADIPIEDVCVNYIVIAFVQESSNTEIYKRKI